LLEAGVTRDVKDNDGNSPFMIAIKNNQFEIAKSLLITAELDPAEQDLINTRLLDACSKADWCLASSLVNLGAASVPASSGGQSALRLSATKGKVSLAKSLMKRAEDNDKNALKKKLFDVLKQTKDTDDKAMPLIKALLNCLGVNVKDVSGNTPLILAVTEGKTSMVKLFLEMDAKTDLKGKQGTALEVAAAKGKVDLVELLVDKGAKPPAALIDGPKFLEAAEEVHLDGKDPKGSKLRVMMACGANVDVKDSTGETALHKAVSKGYMKLIQLLLEKKANLEVKGGEYTCSALFAAAKSDRLDAFKYLVEKGADIESRQADGRTVLGQAVRTGNSQMCQLLLEATSSE